MEFKPFYSSAIILRSLLHTRLGGVALPCAITEENHATAKVTFLPKRQFQAHMVRQREFAAAVNWGEKEVTLVDQPGTKGMGRQFGTANDDIMVDSRFQLSLSAFSYHDISSFAFMFIAFIRVANHRFLYMEATLFGNGEHSICIQGTPGRLCATYA